MPWSKILAVAVTGALQALISPPLNLHFLHWLAWVPLLWAVSDVASGRRRFLLGWLAGVVANVTIFYWIIHTVINFSNLPLPAAVGVLILFALAFGAYAGVFAWGLPRVKAFGGRAWPFAVAAWFAAVEFINPQLFPYFQGVAHYQNPSYFLVVSVTGVAGISFLVLLVNSLAWAAFETLRLGRGPLDRRSLAGCAGATAALFAAAFGYSAARVAHLDRLAAGAPRLKIALVQANHGISTRGHQQLSRNGRQILEDYAAATRRAVEMGAEVVVWPEGASPAPPDSRRGRAVPELARELGVEIWTGGVYLEKDEATGKRLAHNSAWRIAADGTVDARYDKMFLLPFGEYMPGRDVFPALADAIQGVGNFYRGEAPRVYGDAPAPFNFLICYEAIRREMVRLFVDGGSRLLVTITNDMWFGDTSCPTEHLMLTAIRSAEFGLPMVRAANTGISAVIDARGTILAQTGVFEPALLVEDVPLVHAPTVYGRVGDAFAWLCVAASLPALLARRRRASGDATADAADRQSSSGGGGLPPA